MKILVTHFSPDLDAVCSIWLVKRFWPGWEGAEVRFVPAGETLNGEAVDSNPEIIHLDTGLGKFDHHQIDEDTCSAKKVLSSIPACPPKPQRRRGINVSNDIKWQALKRLVEVVNDIDHFREVYYPNPTQDFYDFGLVGQLDGWKLLYPDNDQKIVDLGLACLDGIYKQFQNKVWAEKLLTEEGIEFKTKWGRAVGVETPNDEVIHLGQKIGYILVVRKDPKKGYVRIKSLPDPKIDLTEIVEVLRRADPGATWFLHVNKHMLINGSTKNPKMKPTRLSLREIIEILKR